MTLAATLQEQFSGLLPDTLGIRLSEVTNERVTADMEVRPDMCTVGDVLHGGAIMSFADTLGAVATFANLSEGARTTTLESKTNFLRAAPVGSRVLGETTPLHRGRSTMVWQTRVTTEDDKLVAVVTQTQMVLPA